MRLFQYIKWFFRWLFTLHRRVDGPTIVIPEGITFLPLGTSIKKPIVGPARFTYRLKPSDIQGGMMTVSWAEIPSDE